MSGRESLAVPLGGGTITLTMDGVHWMQLPLKDRTRLLALVDAMDAIKNAALDQEKPPISWDGPFSPCVDCQEGMTIEQKRAAYADMADSLEQNNNETRTDAWRASFTKLRDAVRAASNEVGGVHSALCPKASDHASKCTCHLQGNYP